MPEGDTILRLAAAINQRVQGEIATSSIFRHPRLATLDLTGRTLLRAESQGKHLFLHWDHGRSLHIHLLMQGRVTFGHAEAEEWRRRFEITFESGRLTGVDIPLLHLIATDRANTYTDHLGPDLCGAFDPDVGTARLAADSGTGLTAALLDQRNIAGFGNIYAVEVPFLCGVSPFRAVDSVEGIEHLVTIGAALIRTNAHLGPQNTTGKRMHTGDVWILDVRTRNCPICGTRVERLTSRDSPWRRRSAWCPSCQAEEHTGVNVERIRKMLALHPARRLVDFDDHVRFVGDLESIVAAG
ncbi:MAG: DNA-formamidopyrimidine glycosylase family protein [Acidimicrobiales bacterium]